MADAHTELAREEGRLAVVLAEIERQMDDVREVLDASRRQLLAGRKQMWQDVPHQVRTFDDVVQMSQHALIVGEQERDHALYQRTLDKLERMHYSPYFGRIDFADPALGVEPIYIGISSLTTADGGEQLVYDWRAPVSSMFYDAELGPAAYVCEAGVVEGELLLKRQYNIADGKLLYYFDTSLKIDDDVLQEVLAKHADDKMRHIVTSIQREQNRIIRDEEHPVLIVQGPAGSGKTSIALHRAAYLLYRFRGKLSADNVVIFSPNEVFSDYISNVLPELGEEPIVQVTFIEYARRHLPRYLHLEGMEDQLEYLLTQRGTQEYEERVAGIRFKASEAFLRMIQAYIRYLESGAALALRDVYFKGKLIMGREEMLDRIRHRYSDLPYAKRLGMLYRRVQFILEEPLKEAVGKVAQDLAAAPDAVGLSAKEIRRKSRKIVNSHLKATMQQLEPLNNVDVYALYRRLFESRKLFYKLADGIDLPENIEAIRRTTLRRMDQNQLAFEDVAPLMYLRLMVEGGPPSSEIRHVIVDEAQDYSVFHYEVMRLLFPESSFTILGDMNQSVHPYMNTGRYDGIMGVFGERAHLITLERTYRSTRQIAEFARAVLPGMERVESIQREGAKPRLIVTDRKGKTAVIAREAKRLSSEGASSVALICKTAEASRKLYEALGSELDVVLIEKDDKVFRTGILVLPVYLAKGLEFDGVILCDAEAASYGHETERKAFYTACTRALHTLILVSAGEVTPFISAMPSDLYERVG